MNISNFSDRIGVLIRENQISKAIQEMSQFFQGSPKLRELIMQSARYNALKEKIRLGTILHEQAEVSNNKIMLALLDLAEESETFAAQDPALAAEAEQALTKLFQTNNTITQNHYGSGDNVAGDKIIKGKS